MQQRKLLKISNVYYNMGLSYAKQRNLSSAILVLEKSLEYNKNNIEARNLLGLIYYEIGEIAKALSSWIASINIKKDDNLADIYIYEVSKNYERMKLYKDVISRYNQALIDANEYNKDLAILSLNRLIENNPKFIKAALLLSLLYLEKQEYKKVNKILDRVLKVDKYNGLALKYKEYSKNKLGKNNILTKDNKELSSDDVIIPSNYIAYSGWQTVVNIAIGLLIGSSFIMFLYIPTMKAKLNDTFNKELLVVSEKLNTSSIEKEKLSKSIDALIKERDNLQELSNTSKEDINYKSTQYQKLLAMLDAFYNQDFTRLADLYSDFDTNIITNIDDGSGFNIQSIIEKIKQKVELDGSDLLLAYANNLYEKAEYEKALTYYEKALKLKKDNITALLNKGKSLAKLNRNKEANMVFSDIIINYPNSEQAKQASVERGY